MLFSTNKIWNSQK